MNLIVRLLIIALACVLTACASAPVHYHTMLPPITPGTGAQRSVSFRIDVLPVEVPPQLDRSQLVVRQGRSGVTILDGERWTSPLGDEVRGALSSELADILDTRDAAGLPVQPDTPVLRVKVQIRRLDAWPDHRVQLVADWELGFANEPAAARVVHSGRFDKVATRSYAGTAGACQQAVMDLAARIAADARALDRPRAARVYRD